MKTKRTQQKGQAEDVTFKAAGGLLENKIPNLEDLMEDCGTLPETGTLSVTRPLKVTRVPMQGLALCARYMR